MMRNTFIFSILSLIVVSIFSCSKELSLPNKNAIINKWNIKKVTIDSVGAVSATFQKEILKDTSNQVDLGFIEFIEGQQENTGTWIQRIFIDTLRKQNKDTGYLVSTGIYKIETKNQVYRFFSNSSDTLDTKIVVDTLTITKLTPRADSAKKRRVTIFTCVKSS